MGDAWADVPAQVEFTPVELERRMVDAVACVKGGAARGWRVHVVAFAPLFGLRHIPDVVYDILTALTRRLLPGNLLMGVARRIS